MYDRPAGKSRIELLDLARGVALVAMAVYHFAWDLEFFGYAEPGMTAVGGWKLFARCIASSFLFIVGFSLYLAHSAGIRPRSYLRRLAMVAGAALAISLVTWFAVPGGFIFFGILHQIALASVLGLLFLRLPWFVSAATAVFFVAAPWYLRSTMFDAPVLWWIGLSSSDPVSNDYVPLFPWFGAVLAGIAAANLATGVGLMERLRFSMGRWSSPFRFLGRHSLIVYLVHQPLLIALVWILSQVAPPALRSDADQFGLACEATCTQTHDADFCARYCDCVYDRLAAAGALDAVFASEQDAEQIAMLNETASMCTFNAGQDLGEAGTTE
ncbi:MAG: DUF1624 domain-containing protein [Rhizobiaceae bacterium]|nr:DUF1624 domain-containing protein [Rhizobiaceae bacterium]